MLLRENAVPQQLEHLLRGLEEQPTHDAAANSSAAADSAADVEALRAVGFSDRDILDICEVTSYYAYVNRIADGLGVTVEDWYPPDPEHGHWPGPDAEVEP